MGERGGGAVCGWAEGLSWPRAAGPAGERGLPKSEQRHVSVQAQDQSLQRGDSRFLCVFFHHLLIVEISVQMKM